jgi:hypothetical protein
MPRLSSASSQSQAGLWRMTTNSIVSVWLIEGGVSVTLTQWMRHARAALFQTVWFFLAGLGLGDRNSKRFGFLGFWIAGADGGNGTHDVAQVFGMLLAADVNSFYLNSNRSQNWWTISHLSRTARIVGSQQYDDVEMRIKQTLDGELGPVRAPLAPASFEEMAR